LLRREQAYREDRPEPQLTGKVVVLVDDDLASGASIRAAVQTLGQGAGRQRLNSRDDGQVCAGRTR